MKIEITFSGHSPDVPQSLCLVASFCAYNGASAGTKQAKPGRRYPHRLGACQNGLSNGSVLPVSQATSASDRA